MFCLPLSADWNANKMAEAEAVILEHEVFSELEDIHSGKNKTEDSRGPHTGETWTA